MPALKAINFNEIYGYASRMPNGDVGSGTVTMSSQQAVTLLTLLLVYKTNILANELGVYAISDNVKNGTAYWTTQDPIEWVTTARPGTCARTAISDYSVSNLSKALSKNHVFMEFCADYQLAELDAIWKPLWGTANDLNDALSSEGGTVFFKKFIEKVVGAIGNDFTSVVEFGNAAVITSALAANPNGLAAGLVTRATNTFATADGRLKQVDALKTGSYPHINNTFTSGDISGHTFIGDALGYAESLAGLAHSEFGPAMDALRAEYMYPVCECSAGFFNKLKKDITAMYPNLASSLSYKMNGTLADEMGIELKNLVRPDAIVWDGILFVARYDWDSIAKKVGFYHHRCLLSIPQNFGVAIDVPLNGINQFDGMGMVIQKTADLSKGGKYELEANYQLAVKLLRDKYIVNISLTSLVAAPGTDVPS